MGGWTLRGLAWLVLKETKGGEEERVSVSSIGVGSILVEKAQDASKLGKKSMYKKHVKRQRSRNTEKSTVAM